MLYQALSGFIGNACQSIKHTQELSAVAQERREKLERLRRMDNFESQDFDPMVSCLADASFLQVLQGQSWWRLWCFWLHASCSWPSVMLPKD